MKVLIIGGCGHIGSALHKFLTEEKFDVFSIDLEWFGNPGIKNYKGDYLHLFQDFLSGFDVVILLAGHSSAKMCIGDPISTHYNNVVNFVNLLEKLDKQKFIYASSSSVYGDANSNGCLDENHNAYTPVNYYDLSKKQIDLYAGLSKVEYYGLRFGTVCGWSPNLRNDIMINAMYSAFKTNGEIMLFNPTIQRPILGMNDLVRAILAIITNKEDKRGLYNLASFCLTSGEIAQKMSDLLNCPIKRIENTREVINTKLQSTSYDFSINCNKFIQNFSFQFSDNIEKIVEGLVLNYNKGIKSGRSEQKHYKH